MKRNRLIFLFCLSGVMVLFACHDKEVQVDLPCNWDLPTAPLTLDSCFSPPRVPRGFLVIPPTIGSELHRIAFDPLDEDALYVTTWEREAVSGSNDSDLYRLDLCTNEASFVVTLEGFSLSDLLINAKGDLLSSAQGEGTTIYNLPTLTLKTDHVTEIHARERTWASDSTYWSLSSIGQTPSGFQLIFWVLHALDETMIDTLAIGSGEASPPRNGRTVFKTQRTNSSNGYLYVYDQGQKIFVDSMPPPADLDLWTRLGNPRWLNDQLILLNGLRTMAIADPATQELQVIKAFPDNCKNYEINSIAVIPNRPGEWLYVLSQFFYDESGEYRKRHDLVHYNMATGAEEVLLVNL